MSRFLLLAAALSVSASAIAQHRTLQLKNSAGTTLHTVWLVGPEFLSVGDLSSTAQMNLILTGPSGQALHSIPLTGSEPVRITADGELEVRCAAPTGATSCNTLGPAPAVVVEYLATSAQTPPGQPHPRVAVGQAFALEWHSIRSDVCLPQGPVQLQGWSNTIAPLPSSATRQNLQFTAIPAINPVTIGVHCYGMGAAGNRTVTIQVG